MSASVHPAGLGAAQASLARVLERGALAALLAFVAWGPLAQGSTFAGGRAGLAVLGTLSGGLWLASSVLARQPGRALGSLWALALLALLGWTGLSVALSPAPASAVPQGVLLVGVGLAALAAHGLLVTPERRVRFGLWLLGVAAVMAAYVVLQRLGGGYTLRADPAAASGFYYHPSHYAGFVTLALAVCGWAALDAPSRAARITGTVTGLILAGSLLLTNSSSLPTALLAAAAALVVGVWRRWRRLGQVGAVLLLAGVGVGGWLLVTPAGHGTLDRLMGGIQTKTVDTFLTERGKLWAMDARAASAAPPTGVGPGNFVSFVTRFRPERAEGENDLAFNFVNYAHNDYYQLAIELGWTGLALYLALLLLTLAAAPAQDALGAALLAGLVPLWISGIWDSHATVVPGTMAWAWVAGGAVVAARRTRQRALAAAPAPRSPAPARRPVPKGALRSALPVVPGDPHD